MREGIVVALAVLVGISVDCAPQYNLRTGHFVFSSGIGNRFDPPARIQARVVPEKEVKSIGGKPAAKEVPALSDHDEAHTLLPTVEDTTDLPQRSPQAEVKQIEEAPAAEVITQPQRPQEPEQLHLDDRKSTISEPSRPNEGLFDSHRTVQSKEPQPVVQGPVSPHQSLFFQPFGSFQDQNMWITVAQQLTKHPELLYWLSSLDTRRSLASQPVHDPTPDKLEETRKIEPEPIYEPQVEPVPVWESRPQHTLEEIKEETTHVTERPTHKVEETTVAEEVPVTEMVLSPLEEQDRQMAGDKLFGNKVSSKTEIKAEPVTKIEKETIRKAQEKKQLLAAKRKPGLRKSKGEKPSRKILLKKAKSLTPSRQPQQDPNFRFRQTLFPSFSYSVRHVPVHPASSRFFLR